MMEMIEKNRYMSLATCANNAPWVAAVAYVVDQDLNFYWYSAINAQHSLHLAINPYCAAAIYDSTQPSESADGIQMAGRATFVPEEALPSIMELYWNQSFPDPEQRKRWQRSEDQFVGASPQRFYIYRPHEIYTCDMDSPLIDKRVCVYSKPFLW